MNLVRAPHPDSDALLKLRLDRNLTRMVKRGHPWIYAEALRHRPPAPPGSQALLLDEGKGRVIARGFYDPDSPLAFRVCSPEPDQVLNSDWAITQFEQACALRARIIPPDTTGYRLFNGEGDGLPGLICDIYGDTAVLILDGPGPSGFWQTHDIAAWLKTKLDLKRVYQRYQSREKTEDDATGQCLSGDPPEGPLSFLEYGIRFRVDIVQGQKTGFFLDQRENRQRIGHLAADRHVLNVFGYTGGFSVYAGLGGAKQVTTVDLAQPALVMAEENWRLNGLNPANHQTTAADAFAFLNQVAREKKRWSLVILDPPSLAPSKTVVKKATGAYKRLIASGAAVTESGGLLAAASCSSHIDLPAFLQICEEGISQARRRARLIGIHSQPGDHPTPLACPEFRYLKFILMQID